MNVSTEFVMSASDRLCILYAVNNHVVCVCVSVTPDSSTVNKKYGFDTVL
jgi:hypothetical protein